MSDVKLYSWNSRGMIEQPDGKWVRLDDHNALRAEVEEAEADAREAHKRTDRTIADWNKAQAEIAALRAEVEALRAKLEAARICACREPWAPDTVHRTDGPCYMAEPLAAKVRAAAGQPPEGQT